MTKPIRAKISALGTYVPPRLLTNADLEKMVDTNNEWIMARVGIRERHIVDKGVATSDLAVKAAQKALAQRGLAPTDIKMPPGHADEGIVVLTFVLSAGCRAGYD